MKTFLKIFIVASLLIFISSTHSKAQFEQKFSLQLSGGYVHALSPDFFTQVFSDGFSFDGGVQYNFSRSFSTVVLIKYATFISNSNVIGLGVNPEYNQLGISLCPKYRFSVSSGINPYVFGGLSLNYLSFNIGGENSTSSASLGVIGGGGLDFRINDHVALFWQAGVNAVDSKDYWVSSFFTQVGLNISMFKSKSL